MEIGIIIAIAALLYCGISFYRHNKKSFHLFMLILGIVLIVVGAGLLYFGYTLIADAQVKSVYGTMVLNQHQINAGEIFMTVGGISAAGAVVMVIFAGRNYTKLQQTQPAVPQAKASAAYYLASNGQQQGPYTMAQLQQMASAGQLTGKTYVWHEGMKDWMSAAEVSEVAEILKSIPPVPPQA